MISRAAAAIALLLLTLVLLTMAEAQAHNAAITDAENLLNRGKPKEALAAFNAIVERDANDGRAWLGRGQAALRLQDYREAESALRQATQLNYRPWMSKAYLAVALAGLGKVDEVQALIEEGIRAGVTGPFRVALQSAKEFAALRNQPRFKELERRLQPCAELPYRQFDFWVGDWEVRLPDGTVAGWNKVTLEQDGCLIVEHWKSRLGVETGSSFNYYHVGEKRWHQLYISNTGNAGTYPPMAGEFRDGKIILLTDEKHNPQFRWTWYEISPGKVRQMQERTDNQGKTWTTLWDATYIKQ